MIIEAQREKRVNSIPNSVFIVEKDGGVLTASAALQSFVSGKQEDQPGFAQRGKSDGEKAVAGRADERE